MTSAGRAVAHVVHLIRRFFGAVSPRPPALEDEAWARGHLGPGEREIWSSMSSPDRRHAVEVARRTVAELGPDTGRAVVAAALLHDSGKVISGLGTLARVFATLWWAVADDVVAARWVERERGLRWRLGAYRRHPELGGAMLDRAGADPLTVAWTREHHLPPDRWTVPSEVGRVLKLADDD